MKLRLLYSLLLIAAVSGTTNQLCAQNDPGYDVILLAGQSNMVGYGDGPDNATDAAVDPRIFMWDNVHKTIVAAKDPIIQNQGGVSVGPGLTFAKAYLASQPSCRKVLLVGAAVGGTGFRDGWYAPGGNLSTAAANFTNAAMAAAGAGAKFAGVVWDQGESDVVETDANDQWAAYYQSNLITLIKYFRSNITGATSTTPFVVTEMNYYWLMANHNAPSNGQYNSAAWYAPSIVVQRASHTLPDAINNTAWTDASLLSGSNPTGAGLIHFNILSQRQLGRRDADRFFEAQLGLPQPQTQLVWSDGYFADAGRSYLDNYPFNYVAATSGTVGTAVDTARGNVAVISQAKGYLTIQVPANTFNGSYSKMVWFKPGAAGYYDNLIDGMGGGQSHYLLAAPTNDGRLVLAANHSNGSSASPFVQTVVSAPSGKWENIALTYDATAKTMLLYYNGALVASASNVAPAPSLSGTGTTTVFFGSYGKNSDGSSVAGTDGSMVGNRVWTTVLTAAQISAMYQHELLYRAGF